MSGALYRWTGTKLVALLAAAVVAGSTPAPTYDYSAWNYSDTYQPMSADTSKWTEDFPANTVYVNFIAGTGDFRLDLINTLNSTSASRVVVKVPPGLYHLKTFQPYGTQSTLKPYLMAFYLGNKLQGLLSTGPGRVYVQLDANSYTTDQISTIAALPGLGDSDYQAPLLNCFCRFDGADSTAPILLGGVTFQAADQGPIQSVRPSNAAFTPQPAPFQGVTFNPGSYFIVNDCEFLASAHALTSQPAFEDGCVSTQKCSGRFKRCDFDGRLAASINSARPRRCTVWMGNDERSVDHIDCHLHHSNVSRYAANDEGNSFGINGHYGLLRCKIDHIADLQNRDPAQNNGNSLGGYSDPVCLGWESSNAQITLEDVIIEMDNPYQTVNVPMHLGFTSTGRNTAGGHITIKRVIALDPVHPQLDGFLCVRAKPTNTVWVDATNGMSQTATVTNINGGAMVGHMYAGSWPPPSSFLSPLNTLNDYIIKTG